MAVYCAPTGDAAASSENNRTQLAQKRFLDSGIANSVRKPVIINRRKNPIGIGPVVVGQALRLPAAIPSATEAVALQTRSRPVTISTQLFLFLKFNFLTKQLRIAGVFCQERNYAG